MKKLNAFLNPFNKWHTRWKLRRIIVALEEQQEANHHIHSFARALEATEIMTRGMKKDAQCVITIERAELDSFIRYMTSLHDSKLSRLMLARIGLACLVMYDETALKEPAKKVVSDEMIRSRTSDMGRIKSAVNKKLGTRIR
jgi:hypothetical protein